MITEIKETYDLCNVWKVRNWKSGRFTFPQKHVQGYIQRKLFLSKTYSKNLLPKTDIVTSSTNGNVPILINQKLDIESQRGRYLSKFNNSFVLKVQSCKLYNNKYRVALAQITNTEIFAFIAVPVIKLLSCKGLCINRKDNRKK